MFNRPISAFRLRAPVGNGLQNDPDDVIAVQRQLAQRGYYALGADDPSGFIDRPLIAGIRRFQDENGLEADGWLAPDGETERNLKLSRRELKRVFNPDTALAGIDLSGEIGNGRANQEDDVVGVKRALGALGLYRYDRTAAPSPFIDRAMLDGIKTFQTDHDLKVDGLMQPGGETAMAMKAALSRPKSMGVAKPVSLSRSLLAVADEDKSEATSVRAAPVAQDEDDRPVQMAQSLTDLPVYGAGAAVVGAMIAERPEKRRSLGPPRQKAPMRRRCPCKTARTSRTACAAISMRQPAPKARKTTTSRVAWGRRKHAKPTTSSCSNAKTCLGGSSPI